MKILFEILKFKWLRMNNVGRKFFIKYLYCFFVYICKNLYIYLKLIWVKKYILKLLRKEWCIENGMIFVKEF